MEQRGPRATDVSFFALGKRMVAQKVRRVIAHVVHKLFVQRVDLPRPHDHSCGTKSVLLVQYLHCDHIAIAQLSFAHIEMDVHMLTGWSDQREPSDLCVFEVSSDLT